MYYGLRGVLSYGGFATANTSQKTVLNASYGLRGVLPTAAVAAADTSQKTKLVFVFCFFGANQASYVGGNERARNLLSDAPENDFLVAHLVEAI